MTRKFSWLLAAWAARAGQMEESTPRTPCEARGYCGPFVNQAYFNSLETWAGFGLCVECGRVVPVPRGDRSFTRVDRWLGEHRHEAVAI